MHWFYEPDFELNQSLSVETKRHLASLRIDPSEVITVTNGRGMAWEVLTSSGEVSQIITSRSQESATPQFTLVQALAKSDRDELALQAAVELGATGVVPWQAQRSIVRWDQKAEKNRARWQSIAIESMKQSQRAILPVVSDLATTKQLVCGGIGIILDPRATRTLADIPSSEEYTIVVGPEGGVSDSETSVLEEKGFLSVRLGRGVLRASNAGPAAIAALQLLHGEFRS